MKKLYNLYIRMACSVGAITTGLAMEFHPVHGAEHIGCILLGFALGLLGIVGWP